MPGQCSERVRELIGDLRAIDEQHEKLTARRGRVLGDLEQALRDLPREGAVGSSPVAVAAAPPQLPRSARGRARHDLIVRAIRAFPGIFTSKEALERVRAVPGGESVTISRVCSAIAYLKSLGAVELVGETEEHVPRKVYRVGVPTPPKRGGARPGGHREREGT